MLLTQLFRSFDLSLKTDLVMLKKPLLFFMELRL